MTTDPLPARLLRRIPAARAALHAFAPTAAARPSFGDVARALPVGAPQPLREFFRQTPAGEGQFHLRGVYAILDGFRLSRLTDEDPATLRFALLLDALALLPADGGSVARRSLEPNAKT